MTVHMPGHGVGCSLDALCPVCAEEVVDEAVRWDLEDVSNDVSEKSSCTPKYQSTT
jgi:hypothetical protein